MAAIRSANWGKQDYNGTFGSMNRNKKSVTLDLKSEDGRTAARRLALSADVIIENFRPGTMERLGLGYEALSVANPRLIYCSITGFGSQGPYSNRPGYDTVGQAVSGLLSVLTDRTAPQTMGVSLSDHLAGTFAAYGVLAALMARTTTGLGQKVETSLLQASLAFLGENAAHFFEDGKVPSRATRCHRAQVFAFMPAMVCRSSCICRRQKNSGLACLRQPTVRSSQTIALPQPGRQGQELRRAMRRTCYSVPIAAARALAPAFGRAGRTVGALLTRWKK